jgi:hypothetical protein
MEGGKERRKVGNVKGRKEGRHKRVGWGRKERWKNRRKDGS